MATRVSREYLSTAEGATHGNTTLTASTETALRKRLRRFWVRSELGTNNRDENGSSLATRERTLSRVKRHR